MSDCHDGAAPRQASSSRNTNGNILIALAGQPNMGKSTLFNHLTGLNQHVGNWSGKTIERRDGTFRLDGREVTLVDLPGTYSLTANSAEEVIAREFILREKPDLVLAMVSAANLERSLYLVAELVSLPSPLLLVLNMVDVADQEGIHVDPVALSAALGLPVVPMTATRSEGMPELLRVLAQSLADERPAAARSEPAIRADHRAALEQILAALQGFVPAPYPPEWTALKLLEGDAEMTRLVRAQLPAEQWAAVEGILRQHDDAFLAVASGRYEWIGRMVQAAVEHPKPGQINLTERIDRLAAHPAWGLLILALILGLVFWLTFSLGSPLQNLLTRFLLLPLDGLVSGWLAGSPIWLRGAIVNGALGGVGAVLTFLPILLIFFGAFAFLEDTGYMARAAYVMDNLMHLMGLHGKSFLPLFLGFGCNVPAVMGTRTIDTWQARILTILVAPLVPCTARMAVVAFLAPAFFGANAIYVSWGLVLLSLLALVLSGSLLNLVFFKGQRSAFIMEMPLYHRPDGRTIGLLVWQRSLAFVQKAGTSILGVSMLIWAFSYLPGGDLQSSYLARFGHLIEPFGHWMGFDWRLSVALISSFPAKENAIATLGVLFGGGVGSSLAQSLASVYSRATALSYLAVSILFIPCAATMAVIRQESGSWKWTLFEIALLLVISLGAGGLIYQTARALGY